MKQTKFNCPVEATLSLIGGKYKPLILWHLVGQPLHYMELQRKIPGATPKMLSQHLHELEGCGMVHREVPHRHIASITGIMLSPNAVREYTVLGGFSGITSLCTMPLSSKSRSCWESILGVALGILRCNSI